MKSAVALFVLLPLALALSAGPGRAEDSKVGPSGLPLPRFVTISSDKANMRVGPDFRYPIEWVYQRRGLPVEIVAEYDLWRKVRDIDGDEGWIHKQLLSGKRSAIVQVAQATLYREPDEHSAPVLYADKNVMGKLEECQAQWCRMEIDGSEGWIPKDQIWGAYPTEIFR